MPAPLPISRRASPGGLILGRGLLLGVGVVLEEEGGEPLDGILGAHAHELGLVSNGLPEEFGGGGARSASMAGA